MTFIVERNTYIMPICFYFPDPIQGPAVQALKVTQKVPIRPIRRRNVRKNRKKLRNVEQGLKAIHHQLIDLRFLKLFL